MVTQCTPERGYGIRIIREERGDAALIEPEPPSGRRRRQRSVQRASVGSGRGRHSGATRSLMDLRDGGWQLDGIVVARCWLEGESQQLSSSKWPVRHGLFQVGRVPAAPKFIRQAGWDVAEAFCATNAPLGPAVTHGLGFPLNPILAFLPPLNLFKFRRGVNLSPSFPAHHVRPLLQSMHCHGQLCCSLSAPVSRRLKLLESHGRYITARQCARGAQVPTSAYCGGPFITRPVYPDVQRRLVHCSMPNPHGRTRPTSLSLASHCGKFN